MFVECKTTTWLFYFLFIFQSDDENEITEVRKVKFGMKIEHKDTHTLHIDIICQSTGTNKTTMQNFEVISEKC